MSLIQIKTMTRLFTQAQHRSLLIDLHRGAANIVKTAFLPEHFRRSAFSRYGFKARNVRYTRWKRRVVGHNDPNVFSGLLRTSILTGSRVTATSQRGRVYARMGSVGQRMSGPKKGQYYTRALPDARRQEMEMFSRDEEQQLADWVGQTYVEVIDLPEFANTTLKRLPKF
jgi:hypothetical protein